MVPQKCHGGSQTGEAALDLAGKSGIRNGSSRTGQLCVSRGGREASMTSGSCMMHAGSFGLCDSLKVTGSRQVRGEAQEVRSGLPVARLYNFTGTQQGAEEGS